MTLSPAYGRNYKSIAQVKEAFEAGKDNHVHCVQCLRACEGLLCVYCEIDKEQGR